MCTGKIPVLESREEQVKLVTNSEFGGPADTVVY